MNLLIGQMVCFEDSNRYHSGKIISLNGDECTVEVRTTGGHWHHHLKIGEVTPYEVPPVPPALVSAVNHPQHYNTGTIEVIEAIEDWMLGFNLGNAVKYIARAEHKGKHLEDLEKAAWYLAREIKRRKEK